MKNLTWDDIVFIGHTMQDDNRGGEAVYVGVFGEYEGEPFEVEDYTKDRNMTTLNIYEGNYRKKELARLSKEKIMKDFNLALRIINEGD